MPKYYIKNCPNAKPPKHTEHVVKRYVDLVQAQPEPILPAEETHRFWIEIEPKHFAIHTTVPTKKNEPLSNR